MGKVVHKINGIEYLSVTMPGKVFEQADEEQVNKFKLIMQSTSLVDDHVFVTILVPSKDVFEYNVFGSPNQKIGQFASQTKLGEWS